MVINFPNGIFSTLSNDNLLILEPAGSMDHLILEAGFIYTKATKLLDADYLKNYYNTPFLSFQVKLLVGDFRHRQ